MGVDKAGVDMLAGSVDHFGAGRVQGFRRWRRFCRLLQGYRRYRAPRGWRQRPGPFLITFSIFGSSLSVSRPPYRQSTRTLTGPLRRSLPAGAPGPHGFHPHCRSQGWRSPHRASQRCRIPVPILFPPSPAENWTFCQKSPISQFHYITFTRFVNSFCENFPVYLPPANPKWLQKMSFVVL